MEWFIFNLNPLSRNRNSSARNSSLFVTSFQLMINKICDTRKRNIYLNECIKYEKYKINKCNKTNHIYQKYLPGKKREK